MFMPAASSPSASKTPPATRRTASFTPPEIDSVINDLDDAASGKCLHCGLTLGTISDNERKALALSYNETRLRRRLEEARETLVDRKLFGFGRFDFGGNRLIGDNGLVLQWQTRPEPDQPGEPPATRKTARATFSSYAPPNRLDFQ